VTLVYVRVRGAPKLRRKNIWLVEKYYKFGWNSASHKKIGGGAAQVNKIQRGGLWLTDADALPTKCHTAGSLAQDRES